MKRLALCLWLAVSVAFQSLPCSGQQRDAKKEAELRWSQEVVDQFLSAVCARKMDDALACTTTDFSKKAYDRLYVDFYGVATYNDTVGKPELKLTEWSHTTSAISPDQDEARFVGVIKGPKRQLNY